MGADDHTQAYGKDGHFYQGVAKASTGYKLLAAMGWKEGDGLGANKQGIKEHVKVKKKFDNSGVGKSEADARVRDWTLGMAAFDRVLSGLTEITSKHASGSKGGGGGDSDEASDASGGEDGGGGGKGQKRKKKDKSKGKGKGKDSSSKRARGAAEQENGGIKEASSTAKKAKKGVKAKTVTFAMEPAKVESSSGSDSGSGTDSDVSSSSSSSDDEQPAAAARRRKAVSHVGRFRRREASKAVRSYSSTDLAAIVGVVGAADDAFGGAGSTAPDLAWQPPAELLNGAAANSSDSGEGKEGGSGGAPSDGAGGAGLGSVQLQEGRSGEAAGGASAGAGASGEGGAKAWWSNYFVRAGRLGGGNSRLRGSKSAQHGFTEDDQVALYTLNKETERCGRQGLGVRGLPPKIAGARWKGTKVKLGSDDEDEGEGAEEGEQQQVGDGEAPMTEADAVRKALGGIEGEGVVIMAPLRQRQQQQQQGDAEAWGGAELQQAEGSLDKDGKEKKKKKKKSKGGGSGGTGTASGAAAAAVPKWKKLAAAVLQGAPGGAMQLGKLRRRTLRAAGLSASSSPSNCAAAEALLAALQASSRFQVDGKTVRLVSF